MAYLVVLAADSGVPIFFRKSGNVQTLPFATIGALNGVHMYTKLRGAELQRAVTPEEKLVWKEYDDILMLILITKNDACSDAHVLKLLDNIYASMIMIVGLNTLSKQKKADKLKRELSVCFPLIDYLLNESDQEYFNFGRLTDCVDCMLSTDAALLQGNLNQFLDIADSLYACLLIHGKIVAASKDWWSLTPQEIVLICSHVNSLPKATSREILIHLPTTCQGEFNRLVTLQLLRGVEMCVLCSNTPALSELEEEAPKIWRERFDLLKVVCNLYPRNFPSTIEIDKNILGLLLINLENSQSMCSLQPVEGDCTISKSQQKAEFVKREEALKTLYKLAVETHFKKKCLTSDKKVKSENTLEHTDAYNVQQIECQAQEFYICTEMHKCYAIQTPLYQIFIIYNDQIPHYALRFISSKTLKSLTGTKLFPPQ